MVHISLSPNLEFDDFLTALSRLLFVWKWRSHESTEAFKKELAQYFENQNVYLTASGRGALYLILKSLKFKEDDEVIVQPFTCNAVVNPILWAGAKPIYADIDDTLNIAFEKLEKRITKRTRVIIVQHTFGIPAQVDKISKLAHRNNIIVIEDCAHALGAMYKGRKVGTFGDFAFFSFGRDKVISSVYGGAVVVNFSELTLAVEKEYQTFKKPSLLWSLQQLLHPLLTYPLLLTYSYGGKYLLVLAQKLHLLSYAVSRGERVGEMPVFIKWYMPNVLAYIGLHQFKKLEHLNNHRRTLTQIYERELESNENFTLVKNYDKGAVFLRYPVLHKNVAELRRYMKKKGFILGDWYKEVIAPTGTDFKKMQYTQGLCHAAEDSSSRIINLPTNIRTSEKDAQKIVYFLKNYETKKQLE